MSGKTGIRNKCSQDKRINYKISYRDLLTLHGVLYIDKVNKQYEYFPRLEEMPIGIPKLMELVLYFT